MTKLSSSLTKVVKDYPNLNEAAKKKLIINLYNINNMSYAAIAKLAGTYANKIRRDAVKLGIPARDASQAQSAALESGRHPHPTKDTERSDETKIKISEGMAESWANLSDEEMRQRQEMGREQWNKKTPAEIAELRHSAGEAMRLAAKEGSKLELFLLAALIEGGYEVIHHKKYMVANEKFEIDLFLPALNLVVEVDGPSHFKDIWGRKALLSIQKSDKQKAGLLLGRGSAIIRVRQTQKLSDKFKRDIRDRLLLEVAKVEKKFPAVGKRHIIVEI